MTGGNYFVCYTHKDFNFALNLARDLRRKGVAAWIDQLNTPLGSRYDDEVTTALRESKAVLAILSKDAATSPHFVEELSRAEECNKEVIAIQLDDTELPAIAGVNLTPSDQFDFSEEYQEALEELIESLDKSSVLLQSPLLASTELVMQAPPEMKRIDAPETFTRKTGPREPLPTGIFFVASVMVLLLGVTVSYFFYAQDQDSLVRDSVSENGTLLVSPPAATTLGSQENASEAPPVSPVVAVKTSNSPAEAPAIAGKPTRKPQETSLSAPKTAKPKSSNTAGSTLDSPTTMKQARARFAFPSLKDSATDGEKTVLKKKSVERAWKVAQSRDTVEAYQQFMTLVPSGPRTKQALDRIGQLQSPTTTLREAPASSAAMKGQPSPPSEQASPVSKSPTNGNEVVTNSEFATIQITSAVKDMEPVDQATVIEAGSRALVWAKLTLPEAESVSFNWYLGEDDIPFRARVIETPLAPGGYRIYDGVPLSVSGSYRVVLTRADGSAAASAVFEVVAAEPETIPLQNEVSDSEAEDSAE